MRRVRHDDADETPGGDSFLDIVANIVGILVLLVVVVGVRAGREVVVPEAAPAQADTESLAVVEEQLQATMRRVSLGRADLGELKDRIVAASLEADRRSVEREDATLYVTQLRAELDAARDDLSENDRRSLEAHNAIAQAQLELDRLAREQIALSNYDPEPDIETVTIAPTPIVDGAADKTVTFRLQKGRLVYVPVNEIEFELAKEITVPSVSDPTKPVVTRERLGPIDGFVGEAVLSWAVRVSGSRIGLAPKLDRLVMREVTALTGETAEAAFRTGGYVASRLDLLDPSEIVVRLIVYADSFEDSPAVAGRFRERGFRVAQSLKNDGSPIGFSSDGHKAVTQ